MYVAKVPNHNSPPAYLLREGYREDGKVKSRTLANLSHWPLAKIERLRRVLRDEVLTGATEGLTMLPVRRRSRCGFRRAIPPPNAATARPGWQWSRRR